MASAIIPGKIVIFTWKLAYILFTTYKLQINHEEFGNVIIFDDVSNKKQKNVNFSEKHVFSLKCSFSDIARQKCKN